MRRLTPSDYRSMPWRNGGGTTTEITIAPEGAAVTGGRFLYRMSIADVATDGPFSRFDGYDRHILLLGGAGMTLDCGAHGRIELRARFEPHTFSGDWDVVGSLVSGAVRDLNVMVDRAVAASSIEVRELRAPDTVACEAGTTCLVYVLEGELAGAACGDTLVAHAPLPLVPRGTAKVVIARVSLRAPSPDGSADRSRDAVRAE